MFFQKNLLIFVLIYGTVTAKSDQELDNIDSERYMQTFYNEFLKYDQNNVRTDLMQKLIRYTTGSNKLKLDDVPECSNPKRCLTCRAVTYAFLKYHEANFTVSRLKAAAKTLCTLFDIRTQHICDKYIEIFAPEIEYIINNNKKLTAEHVCAIAFQHEKCGKVLDQKKLLVNIDPNGEQFISSKALTQNTSLPTVKIVQITDPHYDPNYVVGGNAKCTIGACCNRDQGLPVNAEAVAGHWGHYNRCDSPKHAVIDMLNQIKATHTDLDIIYFTGDIIDHFTYATSIEGNTESFKLIFELLEKTFPGVPIYPILGNHEAHPANLFAPDTVPDHLKINWLYKLASTEWSRWLPSEAISAVAKGGYYTTVVRPGLRVVAINNNFCYRENWWLFLDDEYFKEHLQWFHDVLLAAERAGEKVHVLGHVPVNQECHRKWAYNYNLIIERFANTISAQFNGHTHADEFNLNFASYNKNIALNVGWNGGCATTFTDVNPNYSVYEADGSSFEVIDYTTWIYNLTQANLTPNQAPAWFPEYSFKAEFNVPDLSPASLISLTNQFMTNQNLAEKYWMLKVKQGDPKLRAGCSSGCLRSHICEIIENDFHNYTFCDRSINPSQVFEGKGLNM